MPPVTSTGARHSPAARSKSGNESRAAKAAQPHQARPHTTPTSGKAHSAYRMFFSFHTGCGTGTAENMTKTVQFELSRSEDGLSYGNITVMLFPSAANPPLELIITLQDGTEYKLSENLNATLSPNTRLTLNINVGKILVDGNPGDFDYDDWNEESETIDFPIVD